MVITYTCAQCGVSFERPWRNSKPTRKRYCGQDCYNKARTGLARGPYKGHEPEERACVVCGKVFMVGGRGLPGRRVIRCSMACQKAGRYRTGAVAKEMTVADAAYLAGLIDGEGHISGYIYSYRNETLYIKVAIANTYKPVLDWAQEVTGVGSVTARRGSNPNPKHKLRYSWQCNAMAAESVLKQVLPYLRIKPDRAQLALDVLQRLREPAQKADRSWQIETAERFREMNKRGPVAVAPGLSEGVPNG
jgi:hypothetical protein